MMTTVRSRAMLPIEMPKEVEARISQLARAAGQSEADYVLSVLLEYLGDLEDAAIAVHRLQNPEGRTWTLEELEHGLDLAGWVR
jgi:RHH-type transcriptional regulator, rel operon repressor / antitoxin RelB